MNKEDLKVLPIVAIGLAEGLGKLFIQQPLKNVARYIGHQVVGDRFIEQHPISANITYHRTTDLEGEELVERGTE